MGERFDSFAEEGLPEASSLWIGVVGKAILVAESIEVKDIRQVCEEFAVEYKRC